MTRPPVITGPPGSLVDEVAAATGVLMRRGVISTDAEVLGTVGLEPGEAFLALGERAFREREREVAARAIGQDRVVALGGGAAEDLETKARLHEFVGSGGRVVLLGVSVATAAARLGFNQARPVALAGPRKMWADLLDQRMPHYDEVATDRVETDGQEPEAIAARIVQLLTTERET